MNNKNEKRTPNFSPSEKDCLFGIIERYAHVLEDKKTNRISIEEKNQIWKVIEQKFNAEGSILCYRSSDQLKPLYENKKKDLRKKLAEHKKQGFLTNGGPPPDFKLDSIDELLVKIVNEKSVNGLNVSFGSDSIEPLSKKKKENDSSRQADWLELQFIPNENLFEQDKNIEVLFEDEFSSTEETIKGKCPPHHLKRPLSTELNSQPSSSKTTHDCDRTQGNGTTPTSNKDPKNSQKYRRRPQAGVRALTSSDVSEKYNKKRKWKT